MYTAFSTAKKPRFLRELIKASFIESREPATGMASELNVIEPEYPVFIDIDPDAHKFEAAFFNLPGSGYEPGIELKKPLNISGPFGEGPATRALYSPVRSYALEAFGCKVKGLVASSANEGSIFRKHMFSRPKRAGNEALFKRAALRPGAGLSFTRRKARSSFNCMLSLAQ